jgi:hypothetical protein
VTDFFHRISYRLYSRNQGAGDLETEGFLGGTIIGGLRHWDGEYRTFTSMGDMLDAMIDTPRSGEGRNPNRHTSGIIWFHNWANFDGARFVEAILTLLQDHPEIHADIVPQGSNKFIALILSVPQAESGRRYRVVIADSFAVFPASLKDVSEAMVPDMPKLGKCPDHDFEKGGPWFSATCPKCLAYLQRDVDSLLGSMVQLEQLLHKVFKSPMSITAGSIAWKAAQATLPPGMVWYRSAKSTEEWLRPAVHGGFVWPGHKRGDRGPAIAYDHSGAYAASLREGLPYGHPIYRDVYRNDVPGVWDATVTVPHDIPIPILNGPPGGPSYPTGTFRHKFTHLEIDYAEKLGCSFTVHEGVTWDGYEYPFNTFIDLCEQLEYPGDGSKPSPAIKKLVKLMRNALPGKTATRPVITKWRLGTIPEPGEVPYVDEETGILLPLMGKVEEIEGAAYIHPEWNAFITARQRIKIHQELSLAGDGAYYCDTDSKYLHPDVARTLVARNDIAVGVGYGLNHDEGEFEHLIVAGPKNKLCITAEGERHSTTKGIPKAVREKNTEKQILSAQGVAEQIEFESVNSFKARLMHPAKPFGLVRTRAYSVIENSTSWMVDEHDNIRPRRAREQQAED